VLVIVAGLRASSSVDNPQSASQMKCLKIEVKEFKICVRAGNLGRVEENGESGDRAQTLMELSTEAPVAARAGVVKGQK
jgi:hypothetical protein